MKTPKPPTKSLSELILEKEKPKAEQPVPTASPAKPGAPEFEPFRQRARPIHRENFKRLSYWSRESQQNLLDQALTEFFARQDPLHLAPIPEKGTAH